MNIVKICGILAVVAIVTAAVIAPFGVSKLPLSLRRREPWSGWKI